MDGRADQKGFVLLTSLLVLLLLAVVLGLGWARIDHEMRQLRAQEDRLRLLSLTESAVAEGLADVASRRIVNRQATPLLDGLVTVEIVEPSSVVRILKVEGRRGGRSLGLELELELTNFHEPRVTGWRQLPGSY